jgi:hypothetical protein
MRRGRAMDSIPIAKELCKVAKELAAADERTKAFRAFKKHIVDFCDAKISEIGDLLNWHQNNIDAFSRELDVSNDIEALKKPFTALKNKVNRIGMNKPQGK